MKTIGLIGGTGWVSSVEYYKLINQHINKTRGGLNAAKCLLFSFNYAEINALNKKNDLDSVYQMVKQAANKLIACDVDFIVLCANTLHFFAEKLQTEIPIPIFHIAQAVSDKIRELGFKSVGLLGTKTTMEKDFYTSILLKNGITPNIPNVVDRQYIHNAIMKELLREQFNTTTKLTFIEILDKLRDKGAEAMILGCTEIPLLIKPDDYDLPVINTLEIHARKIAEFAMEKH